MRRVIWSARGRTLFDRDVVGYLLDKGEAGQRALDHIDRAIELLARRPIGRPGRMTGTYEKSVTGQVRVRQGPREAGLKRQAGCEQAVQAAAFCCGGSFQFQGSSWAMRLTG